MSDTKFTPGPWCVDDPNRYLVARLVNGQYQYICSVDPSAFPSTWTTDEIDEANAALIAAAPELYAALDHMTHCVRNGIFMPDATLVKAIAALKKARGEQ